MTWKEFKESIEALGITDDSLIYYIDTYSYLKLNYIKK